jgi:ornithine cyclodeaminase/alanine dehydrogenase-like protein (mu-crystallin family)
VRPEAREVDDQVWSKCAQVVVDDLDGVLESGDGASAVANGCFDFGNARELWEIDPRANLRRRDDELTMFKSVGAATQDLAVAAVAYRLARERGIGEEVKDFPSVRSPR